MNSTRGFTLIEVMVAVVLGGITALIAYQVFATVTDVSRRVDQARLTLDREHNAARWLASALSSAEVGLRTEAPFVGTETEMQFVTHALQSHGWFARTTVDLRAADGNLVANLQDGQVVTLYRHVGAVAFDYLGRRGEQSPWLGQWKSSLQAPLAIRLRLARTEDGDTTSVAVSIDTLLFRVGGQS